MFEGRDTLDSAFAEPRDYHSQQTMSYIICEEIASGIRVIFYISLFIYKGPRLVGLLKFFSALSAEQGVTGIVVCSLYSVFFLST